MLKQLIPSSYCLKCLGCCRFPESPTIWSPAECALIKDNGGYVCGRLNREDNRCKIYSRRPLDCQLYPFLLVKRNGNLSLGLHKSCCFIQEKRLTASDASRYADYLKRKLQTPQCISLIGKNPRIAADYQEDVEIVGDLQEAFIKAFAPRLNRLTLKDKSWVERYLKKSNPFISAHHFAGIFIWKDLFRIFWIKIDKSLSIFYRDAIGMFMAWPPLGEVNEAVIKQCFEIMNSYNQNNEVSRIENVSEEDLQKYKEAGLIPKLKDSEYLCSRDDLAGLKGDSFKSKRASYNYFMKHYPAQVLEYNKNMYKDCLRLYRLWMDARKRQGQGRSILYEQMLEDSCVSFQTALRHYNALGLLGYAVKVKGEIKGCSLGYPLNEETFCILFEVCDLGCKGIAQFIFREFCRRLADYKYINIMGSSDLENLKKAKLSFHPIKEIKIYNIYQ